MKCCRAIVGVLLCLTATAAAPLTSGLQPGQRPGPYTAFVSVGAERGQLHCFICETADRPAVIVFARTFSDGLGKVARGIDKALAEHKSADARAWLTFLSDDQPALDPKVVQWAKDQAIRTLPLAVYEDAAGPTSYRLHKDADVTVLLSVKQKVMRNFTLRAGELSDARTAEIVDAIGSFLKSARK